MPAIPITFCTDQPADGQFFVMTDDVINAIDSINFLRCRLRIAPRYNNTSIWIGADRFAYRLS